jgi:hypothetical protein
VRGWVNWPKRLQGRPKLEIPITQGILPLPRSGKDSAFQREVPVIFLIKFATRLC